ncbi:thiol peroxidase [Parafilimonas sp.]|uniref:thiol peroxidase n=1 Tax=Parafilimonas sp. TaxID=1969739 RepID=UPI0039E5C1FC
MAPGIKPSVIINALFICVACLLTATICFAQTNASSNHTIKTIMENSNGTTITLRGEPVHTVGKLPSINVQAKDFTLTAVDLSEKTLADYKGKYIVMNIFPSVNTGVCAKSVRAFNQDAAGLNNTVVLCISKDLPFAQKQFCGAEGIDHVVMLSDFRNDFGNIYGVEIADGALRGLLSRAVVVIDQSGKIVYEQQVPEIGQEPDYAAALKAVK